MKYNGGSAGSLLEARLLDAVRLAEEKYRAGFVGFLDEREAFLAQKVMKKAGFGNFLLWGGYPEAERVMFGAFPEYTQPAGEEFPLKSVTVGFRPCDVLTHRDFLGALMSLGIERSTVGDILVEEARCVMFFRSEVAGFVLGQIEKIGKAGVKLSAGARDPLPQGRGFSPFSAVIASARLDCAAAAATGLSREKAASLITAGAVLLNHEETRSLSAEVKDGDKLSVRGKGRYVLDQVGPATKKGRLNLKGRKYI